MKTAILALMIWLRSITDRDDGPMPPGAVATP